MLHEETSHEGVEMMANLSEEKKSEVKSLPEIRSDSLGERSQHVFKSDQPSTYWMTIRKLDCMTYFFYLFIIFSVHF